MEEAMTTERFRISHFVTKHSHIFTYVGALIVFVTFVVKEGFQENWNDTASAIETAQYMYGIHSATTNAQETLNEVFKVVNIDQMKPERLLGNTDSTEVIWKHFADRVRRARSDRLTFDARIKDIDLLTEKVEVDANMSKDSERLHQLNTHLDIDIKALETSLVAGGAEEFAENMRITSGNAMRQVRRQLTEIESELIELSVSTPSLGEKVMECAEATKKMNRQQSIKARWISGLLFAFGWSLGLLGKLYGVPDASSGD
jgi:hypothetical protein